MQIHHSLLLVSLCHALAITCDQGEYAATVIPTGRRRRRRAVVSYKCKVCAPGTYLNLHAHKEEACFSCPSGLWTDQVGATTCQGTTKCPAGSWGNLGAKAPNQPCHSCSPGFVQSLAGQGECHSCSSGLFSAQSGGLTCTPALASHPNGCTAGAYGPVTSTSASAATCTPCKRDTYSSHTGSETCHSCESGTYQPQTGQTQCLKAPDCPRYYTWSTTQDQCVIRHQYIKYLAAVVWPTFILNFGMKCYSDNWYALFFVYNIIVCIGVGAHATKMQGELISDGSFYTMVGFLAIGTGAFCVNLLCLLGEGLKKLSCLEKVRQPPTGKVASDAEVKRLDRMSQVV